MRGMVRGLGGAALPARGGRPGSGPADCTGAAAPASAGPPATLPRAHSSSALAAHGPGSLQQLVGAVGGGDVVTTPSGEAPQPALSDHSAAVQQIHIAEQQPQQPQQPQQGPHVQQQAAPRDGGSASGHRQQPAALQPPTHRSRSRRRSPPQSDEAPRPTRSRRQRSVPPSTGAAAAHPAKRRRGAAAAGGGSGTPGSGQRPSKYADILHRYVEVPGAVFFIDTPGEVFIGRVNKAESGRRVPAVEVQFLDDSQKYWFPVADVRQWMAEMVRSGSWQRRNPGTPAPDFEAIAAAAAATGAGTAAAGRKAAVLSGRDAEAAAKTLQSLSVSTSRPAASGAQPAVSTGRQRRASDARTASTDAGGAAAGVPCMQRSGSEVKRVGALDIIAKAADLRGASGPLDC